MKHLKQMALWVVYMLAGWILAHLLLLGAFKMAKHLYCVRVITVATMKGEVRLSDPRPIYVCEY